MPAARQVSRRQVLSLGAASALAAALRPLRAVDPPTNVLFIISDDQGYGDFGFNGNRLVKTPNLDQLASESAVYRNYVVAPACSPSRAALLTGRNHLLTGVWGVPPRANIRDDEARLPQFFKAAGYHTMHVGKLDTVKVGKQGPSSWGWDEWMGGGGYEHQDPMVFQPGNNRRETGWAVEIWTDYAIDFLRRQRDEPWFASLAYIIPHLPWVCPESYSQPFRDQGCSESLAACYGSIAQLDTCLGRLFEALHKTGQDERTLVVFVSDNGPTGPEIKAPFSADVPGPDWPKRNVAGLRGHKATVWENGDRVPMLVRWPGRIRPGDRAQFGCAEDVLPTMLDLTGTADTVVPHLPFSGISLRESLFDAGKVVNHPDVFRIAIAGPGSPRELPPDEPRRYEDHHLTLRGPRYKYHALPRGAQALYDISIDPGEQTDLSAQQPEVTARMAAACRKWWDDMMAGGRAFAPLPADQVK